MTETELNTFENRKELDFLAAKHVQHIKEILLDNQNEHDEHKLRQEHELKFKLAATVIDRLFFFMSLFYFVVAFSSLILTIPNFYKF